MLKDLNNIYDKLDLYKTLNAKLYNPDFNTKKKSSINF